jgi:threonine dehydrogenase-like Zn-dependent dehydrogenase
MQAVVFHGVGDIRLEDVREPRIKEPSDAIVRLTASAICGTDLHMVRGTMGEMKPGTIMGHEGVGVVEELGPAVRDFKPGDRVVISSTIACGYCSYCRAGYFSQCDNTNPLGRAVGTAFFGGPTSSGPFDGLQAERARIPFANIGMIKIPDEVTDDQAIMTSDIFPTGFFGAKLAEIKKGDVVAVFGCGPVGQFAIASAQLLGATRVLAVDAIPSRLDMARAQGAETINYDEEDPVEAIRGLTGAAGRADAAGGDASHPARLAHGRPGPGGVPGAGCGERPDREVRRDRRSRERSRVDHRADHGRADGGGPGGRSGCRRFDGRSSRRRRGGTDDDRRGSPGPARGVGGAVPRIS